MRITHMDAFVLDEASLPDDPTLTVAELRALASSEEAPYDGLGLRRLLEHPEELAPSYHYELD